MHESKSRPEAARGDSAMQPCGLSWYCKGSKNVTIKTLSLVVDKGPSRLFRDYLSFAVVVGVLRGERRVSVPLQQLFRYEWMDIKITPKLSRRCAHRDTSAQRLSLPQVIDSAIVPKSALL